MSTWNQALSLISAWTSQSAPALSSADWRNIMDQLRLLVSPVTKEVLVKAIGVNPEIIGYLDPFEAELLADDQALLTALGSEPDRLLLLDDYLLEQQGLLRKSLLIPCLKSALDKEELPDPHKLGRLFGLLPAELRSDRALLLLSLKLDLRHAIFNWLEEKPRLSDYPQHQRDWEMVVYFVARDGQDLLLVSKWCRNKDLLKLAVLSYPEVLLVLPSDLVEVEIVKLAISVCDYLFQTWWSYDHDDLASQLCQTFNLARSDIPVLGQLDQLKRELMEQLLTDKTHHFSVDLHQKGYWAGFQDLVIKWGQ